MFVTPAEISDNKFRARLIFSDLLQSLTATTYFFRCDLNIFAKIFQTVYLVASSFQKKFTKSKICNFSPTHRGPSNFTQNLPKNTYLPSPKLLPGIVTN